MSNTPANSVSLSVDPKTSLLSQFFESHEDFPQLGSSGYQGFTIGGPALLAFFEWIEASAEADKIDHVIFLDKNFFRFYNYYLEKKNATNLNSNNFKFSFLKCDANQLLIAGLTEVNFSANADYFIDRMKTESFEELFEDIGVDMPASYVLKDFGLLKGSSFSASELQRAEAFLQAWRSRILDKARSQRRNLLRQLLSIGIQEGQRVGVVDFGPDGSLLNSIEIFNKEILNLELFGYSFVLNDSSLVKKRASYLRISGLLDRNNASTEVIRDLEKIIPFLEDMSKSAEASKCLFVGRLVFNMDSIIILKRA